MQIEADHTIYQFQERSFEQFFVHNEKEILSMMHIYLPLA